MLSLDQSGKIAEFVFSALPADNGHQIFQNETNTYDCQAWSVAAGMLAGSSADGAPTTAGDSAACEHSLSTIRYRHLVNVLKRTCAAFQIPFLALATFGLYMLALLLHGTCTFRSCPEEAASLHKVRNAYANQP